MVYIAELITADQINYIPSISLTKSTNFFMYPWELNERYKINDGSNKYITRMHKSSGKSSISKILYKKIFVESHKCSDVEKC